MERDFKGLYHSLVQTTTPVWYFVWQARNSCTVHQPPQVQMFHNTLDSIQEFHLVCTVAQQTGHIPMSKSPYSFEEYKALLITTAKSYDV